VYSEEDSEIPPSKTPVCSISASCLAMVNMESNPPMKSSRYSPGEKEKEEGVDGGESNLEEEEHCLMRGGVEPLDPTLVVKPPMPGPTEAAVPGVGVASLQLEREPMDSSGAVSNVCELSLKKNGCVGEGDEYK
jgi:hypothetical protein